MHYVLIIKEHHKRIVYLQPTLHFDGFLMELQSSVLNCVRNVLVWKEDKDISTDSTQCILGVEVTGIE